MQQLILKEDKYAIKQKWHAGKKYVYQSIRAGIIYGVPLVLIAGFVLWEIDPGKALYNFSRVLLVPVAGAIVGISGVLIFCWPQTLSFNEKYLFYVTGSKFGRLYWSRMKGYEIVPSHEVSGFYSLEIQRLSGAKLCFLIQPKDIGSVREFINEKVHG